MSTTIKKPNMSVKARTRRASVIPRLEATIEQLNILIAKYGDKAYSVSDKGVKRNAVKYAAQVEAHLSTIKNRI